MERKRGQLATMTAQPCRWTLEYAILRMNATTCKWHNFQRNYLLNCFWLLSDVIFSGKVGPLAIVLQDLASVAKVNLTAKSDPLGRFYILGWLSNLFLFLVAVVGSKGNKRTKALVAYFENPNYPSSTKSATKSSLTIIPNNPDICQIRQDLWLSQA